MSNLILPQTPLMRFLTYEEAIRMCNSEDRYLALFYSSRVLDGNTREFAVLNMSEPTTEGTVEVYGVSIVDPAIRVFVAVGKQDYVFRVQEKSRVPKKAGKILTVDFDRSK